MAGEVQAVLDAVARAKGAQASAVTGLQEFAKYVLAHQNDPAALAAAANDLLGSTAELEAAVAANPDPDPND